jgi:hypothetical protein
MRRPRAAAAGSRSRQHPRSSTASSPHSVCPTTQETTQRPPAQTCPLSQLSPQVPQLARSVWRSRQAPLQSERPVPHEAMQRPPEQVCPPAHDTRGLLTAFGPGFSAEMVLGRWHDAAVASPSSPSSST